MNPGAFLPDLPSQAQEELLLELQGRLKETTGRLHVAQERGQQFEAELASAQERISAQV